MFAGGTKISRIVSEDSCLELQNDLAKLHKWSQKWQMESNPEKCHLIKFGKSGMRPGWVYKLGNDKIQESEKEKDLVIVINNRLSPEEHLHEKVRNMQNLLANI